MVYFTVLPMGLQAPGEGKLTPPDASCRPLWYAVFCQTGDTIMSNRTALNESEIQSRLADLPGFGLRVQHGHRCRLLGDGVDIRTIQLMLGHADIKQTQRYLNITDEELRKAMTGVWERRRQLRAVSQ